MIQNGEAALHRAALYEHVEVVKILVDYGAAVDIRNKAYIAIDLDSYTIIIMLSFTTANIIVGGINCLRYSQRPRLPGSV